MSEAFVEESKIFKIFVESKFLSGVHLLRSSLPPASCIAKANAHIAVLAAKITEILKITLNPNEKLVLTYHDEDFAKFIVLDAVSWSEFQNQTQKILRIAKITRSAAEVKNSQVNDNTEMEFDNLVENRLKRKWDTREPEGSLTPKSAMYGLPPCPVPKGARYTSLAHSRLEIYSNGICYTQQISKKMHILDEDNSFENTTYSLHVSHLGTNNIAIDSGSSSNNNKNTNGSNVVPIVDDLCFFDDSLQEVTSIQEGVFADEPASPYTLSRAGELINGIREADGSVPRGISVFQEITEHRFGVYQTIANATNLNDALEIASFLCRKISKDQYSQFLNGYLRHSDHDASHGIDKHFLYTPGKVVDGKISFTNFTPGLLSEATRLLVEMHAVDSLVLKAVLSKTLQYDSEEFERRLKQAVDKLVQLRCGIIDVKLANPSLGRILETSELQPLVAKVLEYLVELFEVECTNVRNANGIDLFFKAEDLNGNDLTLSGRADLMIYFGSSSNWKDRCCAALELKPVDGDMTIGSLKFPVRHQSLLQCESLVDMLNKVMVHMTTDIFASYLTFSVRVAGRTRHLTTPRTCDAEQCVLYMLTTLVRLSDVDLLSIFRVNDNVNFSNGIFETVNRHFRGDDDNGAGGGGSGPSRADWRGIHLQTTAVTARNTSGTTNTTSGGNNTSHSSASAGNTAATAAATTTTTTTRTTSTTTVYAFAMGPPASRAPLSCLSSNTTLDQRQPSKKVRFVLPNTSDQENARHRAGGAAGSVTGSSSTSGNNII